MEDAKQYPEVTNIMKPKKIVLIIIDTLRADHLGCYGYKRNTSPNIDDLAKDSILFKHAFSPSSLTIPSICSILTSKYPGNHSIGFDPQGKLDPNIDITLALILCNNNYKTAAFVGSRYLRKNTNLNAGFELYEDETGFDQNGRRDCLTTNLQVIKWLEENYDQDFFLFVHYFDVHGPYVTQEPFKSEFVNDEFYGEPEYVQNTFDIDPAFDSIPEYQILNPVKNENTNLLYQEKDVRYYKAQYDGCIRHLDENLGQLLKKLKELEIYEDSLIIVTSDHGEAHGENNIFFSHGLTVTLDQTSVPLLLKPHNDKEIKNRLINTPVSAIDIMPTVFSLCDHDYSSIRIEGHSLAKIFEDKEDPLLKDRTLVSENEWQFALIQPGGLMELKKKDDPVSSYQPHMPALIDSLNGKKFYWDSGNEYLLNIPFDQYQRYKIIADVINQFRNNNTKFKILDVGASFEGNLKKFLPHDEIYFLDKEYPPEYEQKNNYITGDVTKIELNDTYDFVVSLDVYEHIHPVSREEFINKLLNLSTKATIIAAPFDTSGVREHEILANEVFKISHGIEHKWLHEHIQNGLPSLPFTLEMIKNSGFNPDVIPNGYLPRWHEMISIYLLIEGMQEFSKNMEELNEYYNKSFYCYDNLDPAYRHVIIINKTNQNIDFSGINALLPELDKDFSSKYEMLKSIIKGIKELCSNFRYKELLEKRERVTELTEKLTRTIATFHSDLQSKDERIKIIESQLQSIHESIVWRLLTWYHKNVVERTLPHGTRRKRLYDTALKTGRIIVNEGWRSFSLKFNEEMDLKKTIQQKDQQINQKEQKIQHRDLEINKSFVKKYHKKIKDLYILAKACLQEEGLRILIIRSKNFMIYGQGVLDKKEILIRKKSIGFGDSAYDLYNIDYNFKPKITVIVPNYNHEKFLRQRLDSIFSQTYQNYEVILLDDNSSDNSKEILNEYANKYKDNTKYIFNESNSGSVFNQWKRGIEEANGELIWIAESDDHCTDNFISSLVPFFSDESVMIAYCRSIFEKNGAKIWDIESYLVDIDQDKWKSDFIETAHKIVNYAMAKKNIIPNMSSAMFRNPGKMSLLDDEKWKSLRFCGDWVFYLYIMRGGAIAYTTKAVNYYRQHEKNTSTKLQGNDIYYIEHEYVAMKIAELYSVSPEIFDNQKKMLQDCWKLYRKTYDEDAFNACYDITKIKDHQKCRKPNIAMFGFSFVAGGGETFPIILANLLHENGYGVTFVDCDREGKVEGVRKMLKQSIPVIKLSDLNMMALFVKSLGIEILHSHHAWVDSNINQMIEYMPGCSHIVTLHGMYEMLGETRLEAILPSLCAGVDQWVYTTDKNIEAFKRYNCYNENKFVKIGNALVRSDIKCISRETLDIDKDAFVLCLVSRAVPEKGWEEAIHCVGQARSQSGRDIQLIIIGDGSEKNRLQNQAPVFVKFLGFKSNIRDYYAMADMGFLPSRFKGESFPLTIIDCLFAGKPIIASNIGEINKMLRIEGEKYAGALFDLNNWTIPEKELIELIIKCATDIEFYNVMSAEVETAASRFDINNVFLRYCACYDKLFNLSN